MYLFAPVIKSVGFAPTHGGHLSPGDRVHVFTISRSVSSYRRDLSTDGGHVWHTLAPTVKGASYPWIVPNNLYSHTCKLRAVDLTAPVQRTVESPMFQVIPTFTLTSDITKPDVRVYVPGIVTVNYHTNSSLVTPDNVTLQVSNDGLTWEDHSAQDPINIQPDRQRITWNLSDNLAGESRFVRLTTNHLKQQGYAHELNVSTPGAVRFISTADAVVADSTGSDVTGHPDSASGVSFTPGRPILLTYTVSTGSASPGDFKWAYSTDDAKTWTDIAADTASSAGTHAYYWTVPLDVLPSASKTH